jgi:hypothetical protein
MLVMEMPPGQSEIRNRSAVALSRALSFSRRAAAKRGPRQILGRTRPVLSEFCAAAALSLACEVVLAADPTTV